MNAVPPHSHNKQNLQKKNSKLMEKLIETKKELQEKTEEVESLRAELMERKTEKEEESTLN